MERNMERANWILWKSINRAVGIAHHIASFKSHRELDRYVSENNLDKQVLIIENTDTMKFYTYDDPEYMKRNDDFYCGYAMTLEEMHKIVEKLVTGNYTVTIKTGHQWNDPNICYFINGNRADADRPESEGGPTK